MSPAYTEKVKIRIKLSDSYFRRSTGKATLIKDTALMILKDATLTNLMMTTPMMICEVRL